MRLLFGNFGRSTFMALGLTVAASASVSAEPKIQFSRDVRPILSDACYQCHGPDKETRQGGLRLDERDGAFATLDSGGVAIVPGDLTQSQLIERITSEDPDLRMPPPDSDKKLSPQQIDTLKSWVKQGAEWKGHWAFEKPQRPELPTVKAWPWPKNEVDYFILARLEQEGLLPSPEADKETLIRRVTLDLTGLPPTIAEVDQFLADKSPGAYEKLVDRLLASPHYGEQMARYWLDAARYGDTHGLHLDNERVIWPYRDWVINAYNRNLPYDQFAIEQLAGDLLPNPTLDQLVATGFNRCNVTTSEGGSIDEEYYCRYAVDRVETTSTVFMSLTLGCAVCHDHKYDPFSQKEFYQLFAFFNSLTEKAMDGNALAPPPVIKVPTQEQKDALARLNEQITGLAAKIDGPMPAIDAAQADWEQEWSSKLSSMWQPVGITDFASTGGASLRKLDDGSILAEGTNADKEIYDVTVKTELRGITAIRLEALVDDALPARGPGRADNANFVLSEFEAEAQSVTHPEKSKKIKFQLAKADYAQASGEYFIDKAIDGKVDGTNGWAVDGDKRHENRTAFFIPSEPIGYAGGTILKLKLRHESQFSRHSIGRFRFAVSTDQSLSPVRMSPWLVAGPFRADSGDAAFKTAYGPETDVTKPIDPKAVYDGELKWVTRKFKDGAPNKLRGVYAAHYLYRTIRTASPRQLTLHFGSDDALKVWVNGQVVLEKNEQRSVSADSDAVTVPLAKGENRLLLKVVNYGGEYAFYFRPGKEEGGEEWLELASLLTIPPEQRNPEQAKQLRDHYRGRHSAEWQGMQAELARLRTEEKQINDRIPTTLIMEEMPQRRDAFVLIRGEYDKKGEKVQPAVPAALPPLPEGAPANRLGLAQWLVSPEHPLTARVAVNRYWQKFFGVGIVKTAEDFGSQGEWPKHPELLDWLATEFIRTGWDIKRMQRLLVTSATYRQSSKVTPQLLQVDRENRLLARGHRFRMDAEMVRDNALFVSGLLVDRIGGGSVKPYQPAGLWEAVGYTDSNTAKFTRDNGEALYRRSMYTFWKRTAPPPSMMLFDAPSREACTVRRSRTNTPLQALALMNDEQFVEASRHLAERILLEGGSNTQERINFVFRHLLARAPDPDEAQVLAEQLAEHSKRYREDPEAATRLLSVGESKRNDSLDAGEVAAWTMIANLMLNLDETLTK
jgi:hypothetical protein